MILFPHKLRHSNRSDTHFLHVFLILRDFLFTIIFISLFTDLLKYNYLWLIIVLCVCLFQKLIRRRLQLLAIPTLYHQLFLHASSSFPTIVYKILIITNVFFVHSRQWRHKYFWLWDHLLLSIRAICFIYQATTSDWYPTFTLIGGFWYLTLPFPRLLIIVERFVSLLSVVRVYLFNEDRCIWLTS